MKSSILDSNSAVGMITNELPLSARVIMVSCSFIFVFMFLRVVDSERVLCVCVCVCVCVRVYCSFVGRLCVQLLVFCIPLVVKVGDNRQFLIKKLTPSYARIMILDTYPAHKHTLQKVTTMRINDEIKFLHCKKKLTYQFTTYT